MRKFITILSFLLVSCFVLAQPTLIDIQGTVADPDGIPVPEVPVFISTSFSDSTFFFTNAFTGPEGQYEITIEVTSGDTAGVIHAAVPDCNGLLLEQQAPWSAAPNSPDPVEIMMDFAYCSDISIDSLCFVFIAEEISPDGDIQLTAYAPTFPINDIVAFDWSSGETTQSISPAAEGTYCVTASFANGCTAVSCYDYFPDSNGNCWSYIEINYTNTDSTTGGGLDMATLSVVSAGEPPFTYAWDNGETGQSIVVGPGIYCVTVTDASGCIFETCADVIDFLFCEVFIACDPPGSFQAIAFGVEPFTYLWNTGDTTMALNPEEPGEYCVTVTDATGCIVNTCAVFDTIQPVDSCLSFITFFADSVGGNPADTAFTLSVTTFGQAPYTYAWSTGDSSSSIVVPDLSQIYCVTVTDAAGCVSVACSDIWNNFCFSWVEVNYIDSGTAILEVFTESLSPTVNWIWSNGETGPTITATESGTYCVNVMDELGCMSEACAWVEFGSIPDSCGVFLIPTIGSDSMNTTITVEAFAFGQAPYTYLWSDNSTSNVTVLDDPNTNLCVTVTDAAGCESIACLQDYIDPCQIYIEFGVNDADSTISLTATTPFGSGAGGSYAWSTGEATQTITVDVEGTYCVTASLSNGCTTTACVDVIFTPVDTSFNFVFGFVVGTATEDLSGTVYAYRLAAADSSDLSTSYELVDSTAIQSGNLYAFNNLPSGIYLFKAVADASNTTGEEYFPTYHYDAIQWENATQVALPNWLPVTTDIFLQPVNNSGGGGLIGGTLLDPDGLLAIAGTATREGGLAGIQINLVHQTAGNFRYTHTDEDGNFSFSNLPWGTYKVTYDDIGHDAAEVWITIGPNNPENTGIVINSSGTTVAAEDLSLSESVSIFPNPASNRTTIRLDEYTGQLDLRLVSISGMVLRELNTQYLAGENLVFDLSQLEKGTYLLEVRTDRGTATELIMKQ